MNRRIPFLPLFMVVFFVFLSPPSALSQDELWKRIDNGLFLGEFDSRKITLLRIDPKYYSFRLLCASEKNNLRMTAKQWCQKNNLISAMNAGMFQADGITNVGYMKNFNHMNNPRLNTQYKAILAFNPVDTTVPEVQIIDMKCQDSEGLRAKYQTLIQSIRMISCRQENVWQKQNKLYSITAFGMDKSGKGLFIFAEPAYSVHDLTNILLSLPISLYNAMYLEGGPEATLYLSGSGVEFEKLGTHDTGLNENDFLKMARPLPNVIGIVRKPR